jgi:hypothetical protein
MSLEIASPELTPQQLRRVSRLVYTTCGIDLQPGKEGRVRARLARRVQWGFRRGEFERSRQSPSSGAPPGPFPHPDHHLRCPGNPFRRVAHHAARLACLVSAVERRT